MDPMAMLVLEATYGAPATELWSRQTANAPIGFSSAPVGRHLVRV